MDNTNNGSPVRGGAAAGAGGERRKPSGSNGREFAAASSSAATSQTLPLGAQFNDHGTMSSGSSHDAAGAATPLEGGKYPINITKSSAPTSPSSSTTSLNPPHNDRSNINERRHGLKRRHSNGALWISKVPFISRYFQGNWSETTLSGWHMMRLWVFGMITPLSVLTWTVTHRMSAVVASIVVLPTVAILQGSFAIWRYRVQFGDSPLPMAPSHGIVKCRRGGFVTNVGPAWNGNGVPASPPNYGSSSYGGGLLLDGAGDDSDLTFGASFTGTSPMHGSSNTTPLRLLVIGDSLAIGVGQSKCSTPIMPETIAKSLSKAMNGRPVLWTCHGAPGASAGWIVREMERSINNGQFMQADPPGGTIATPSSREGNSNRTGLDADSYSSSDESSVGSGEAETPSAEVPIVAQEETEEELKTWSDRLKEHRIRFDPNALGPFDIAVVLTGSNDLKSAFFPFLLKGEDAEFRKQAQLRGGGYGSELTRILQVLNRRMRMRLQTLREQVEAASERVRESVDNIRERLGSHDFNSSSAGDLHHNHGYCVNSSSRRAAATLRRTVAGNGSESELDSARSNHHPDARESARFLADGEIDATNHSLSHGIQSSFFPMVVLPAMPSRALPIFQTAPLRWLAVPIVDIMDSHKKNLARQHDGEVFFVDAPSVQDIAAYAAKSGTYYKEETEDKILLQLRDIKRKQARCIERDMARYFSKRDHPKGPESLPLRKRHFSMFSADGIHPNDEGYDFWGRYIANAIVEEWKRKQQENGVLDVV